MNTPSHPSPTNLSDELDTIIRAIERDYIVDSSEPLTNAQIRQKAKAAITAAYAEAIRSAVPEKRDTKTGEYECAHCGSKHAVYQPVHSSDNAYNAAIDTMLKNLKERGLIK